MPALANDERAGPRFWGALTVGLLAFAAYAWAATPTAYPLDSAEIAAAAFGLGVAHPPGEATTLLWARLFTLLPLGSVTFKVALSQATAGALAAVLAFLLGLEAAARIEVVRERTGPTTRALLAAGAALAFAYAPGVIIVSNRPEVYATQTALSLAALWLVVRAHAQADARPALLAGLFIGLGVGNHSLVAGLVGLGAVAAVLPMVVRSPTKGRFVGWALAAFAVGLWVHAYLPVRAAALFAAADRGIDNVVWGDGRSWAGLWWIVSARTFAEKTGLVHGNASPADLPFLPLEELTTVFAVIAPAGAYFLLRESSSRVAGLALVTGAAGAMAAALTGGLDPGNPDIRGYLGPAFALIAVCSGVAIAVGTAYFGLRRLRPVIAVLFFAAALSRFPSPGEYPGLRAAHAADVEAGAILADVPPAGALLTHHFETAFLVSYRRLVEGARPDVAWLHLPFVPNPSYAARSRAARPELAGVVDAVTARVPLAPALSALAASRPIRVEPDGVSSPALREALTPSGLLWGLRADSSTAAPWPALTPSTLAEAARDPQVRGYLAWRRYMDATWACQRGYIDRARARFAELEQLVPADLRFQALRQQCVAATP